MTVIDGSMMSRPCREGRHTECVASKCWCDRPDCHPFRCVDCGRVEGSTGALEVHRYASHGGPAPKPRSSPPIVPTVLPDGRHRYDLPPVAPAVTLPTKGTPNVSIRPASPPPTEKQTWRCSEPGCEGREFGTAQARGAHTRWHKTQTVGTPDPAGYTCPDCTETFESPQSLGGHRALAHRPAENVAGRHHAGCQHCDWTETHPTADAAVDALQAHLDGAHPTFGCDACGGAWPTEAERDVHVALHDDVDVKADCPECGETVADAAAMAAHILGAHPPGATVDVAVQHDRYFALLRDLYGKTADPGLLDRMERLARSVEARETEPWWGAHVWFIDESDPADLRALAGQKIHYGYDGATKITYGKSTHVEVRVGADDILTLPHEARRSLFAILDVIAQTIGDGWRGRLRKKITDTLTS